MNIARRHNVTGYVRNLADGRVELVVEGPESEIENVIEGVKERMDSYIQNLSQTDYPATGEFAQFYIRHC
jgi:acylphosphatase